MAQDREHIATIVRSLLAKCELPRDALPYTVTFDHLKKTFQEKTGQSLANHAFWKLLGRIGKRGGLAGKGGRKQAPPGRKTTQWQKLEILRLLPDGVGSRDDLPYTARFDELYRRFSLLTGTRFTKHDFWRAVSSVGKRGRKPKPVFTETEPPLGGLMREAVDFLERNNPWWRGHPGKQLPSLLRWAYQDVYDRLHSEITPIVALRGARQVGKTTIQQQLIDHLINLDQVHPRRILHVQFDDVPSLGSLKNPIEMIVKWYEQNVLKATLNQAAHAREPAYLLLDEVQNLPNWSAQLKSLVDNSTARIMVTGSSALRIAKGQDSLAGRLNTVDLGPLRLHEIVRIREIGLLKAYSEPGELARCRERDFWEALVKHGKDNLELIDQAFGFFSRYGGYPVCHNNKNADRSSLLASIVESVIKRTIGHERAQGASEDVVRETFFLLCRNVGNRLSLSKLARQVGQRLSGNVTSNEVNRALTFLEEALLVRLLQPLEVGRKRQNGPPTICLCDHFIRCALLKQDVPLVPRLLRAGDQSLAMDAGLIIESIIGMFLDRLPGLSVSTFPGNHKDTEVDFVLQAGMSRIPIEVKYQKGKITNKDTEGLLEFCAKPQHEATFGIIVTQERSGPIGDKVIAVPAKTLLAMV